MTFDFSIEKKNIIKIVINRWKTLKIIIKNIKILIKASKKKLKIFESKFNNILLYIKN